MRTPFNPDRPLDTPEEIDTDSDRYPDATAGIQRILDSGILPDGPVERVEIAFLASGEGVWRTWTPRALEPEGGYLAPE